MQRNKVGNKSFAVFIITILWEAKLKFEYWNNHKIVIKGRMKVQDARNKNQNPMYKIQDLNSYNVLKFQPWLLGIGFWFLFLASCTLNLINISCRFVKR